MTDSSRAARIIARSRLDRDRLGPLPAEIEPPTIAAAYELQELVHAELTGAGWGEPIGFKIGCTTAVMQAYLDIPNPCAGAIFGPSVHRDHGVFRRVDYVRLGVETEIAVRLGADLPADAAPFTRASIAGAVSAAMASIEVVDDRYTDYRALGVRALIADDFFNAGCVLGPERADWHALDLAAIGGTMWVNGREVGSGRGGDILGHPLEALAWLAGLRAASGRPLRAGAFVSLGSVVQTQWLDAGDEVLIRVEGLGEARASVT